MEAGGGGGGGGGGGVPSKAEVDARAAVHGVIARRGVDVLRGPEGAPLPSEVTALPDSVWRRLQDCSLHKQSLCLCSEPVCVIEGGGVEVEHLGYLSLNTVSH